MKTPILAALLLAAPSLAAFAAEAPTPEKFYASKCASCHGKDARGNAKMLKMFKVEAKDLDLLDDEAKDADAKAVKAIVDGKGKKMPAYKEKLEGLDPAALVSYIRGLKPAKAKGEAKP